MNECKHERINSKGPIYVSFMAPDLTGEPRLRFDMTALSEGVADAVVNAYRLASALVGSGVVWHHHSIEQKCLDCEQLITFYDLQGANPE